MSVKPIWAQIVCKRGNPAIPHRGLAGRSIDWIGVCGYIEVLVVFPLDSDRSRFTGRITVNVVPSPILLSTRIWPLWSWMIP